MTEPRRPAGRKRPSKNTYTTKSGNAIKLNQSLVERYKAGRDAKARRRAAYMSTLPTNRLHRMLYRLKPRELARFWFSRDGAIMALKIVGVGIVVFFVLIVGTFAYFRKDIPKTTDLSGRLGGSITYYDRTGQTVLWQDYDAVKRQAVSGDQMNNYVRNATVAIEDKDFYKHGAFDVRGIVRAGVHDLTSHGDGVQGGSTISQQLVKLNEDWTADRSITRKIKEVIVAVEVEREYSKKDILTGYLNIAPYGPVEYGVQVASQDYFGVDAKDLSLAQASMLAAIPKSPNVYSPYGPVFSAQKLKARQEYILDQMAQQHMITQQQANDAKKVDILSQVKPREQKYTNMKAPYFVLAAKEELESTYGSQTVKRGGWKVITTVDLGLQDLAEKQVAADLPTIHRQGGDNAAFVAEDNKTGQIVALVGGVDFNDQDHGQINYATDVNVSPGSSFKPYDYTTFIENNTDAGAGAVLYDSQGALPGYPCTHPGNPRTDKNVNCLMDYDLNFPGPVTLRYALGGSRNIPAVKAMLSAVPNDKSPGRVDSINKTINTAVAMMDNPSGDTYRCYQPGADVFKADKKDETQCYGSSAIGDGAYLHLDDHVNGIATLARMGVAIPRTYILKITDSNNKLISQFKQPVGKQVIHADTAYIVDDMASDPRASYLPGNCTDTKCTLLSSFGYKFHRYNGWHFAVKTGTTNDAYDGLMASWSTQYTAVTWVGYHTRTKAMSGNMETMTEPIVRGWMQGAHDMLHATPVNWQQPNDVKSLPAFVVRGKISRNGEQVPSPSNDLFPSWYVAPKASGAQAAIDLVSNKLATSCTPDLAKKTEGGANDNTFSADIFFGSRATSNNTDSNTTATDDVHNCNDAKPVVSLTAPDTCTVGIPCTFTVAVSQGTHPLSGGSYTDAPAGTLSLLVDNQAVQSVNIPPDSSDSWNYTFSYTPTAAGTPNIVVQAVDSVLYSATQQATTTITNGTVPPH